ncbi:hypothetical protein WM40_10285 [Robbsia andropogonis]|uniref:Uncharacterized protein n=1 Tax=Robbsia andropogonis TaxID=28092 RepID=A0A0F5K0T1_9BURK|nr:hypothetical protein [Robbsia andropogonis]KKB63698.1 hypothetical protein WM40_10285 [Robbsia andropogonis]MCP1119287.1 hypothetical protein [Robbsia andropogonis]MCP1129127.1 hypothetical protein [Robbsia andropogonis]
MKDTRFPTDKVAMRRNDDAIARFNALFKSRSELERDAEEAERAQRAAETAIKWRAQRDEALETVRASISAHGFSQAELFDH